MVPALLVISFFEMLMAAYFPTMQGRRNRARGGGALCVEMGFTWTFPRNQDAKVKLKSELISIKF